MNPSIQNPRVSEQNNYSVLLLRSIVYRFFQKITKKEPSEISLQAIASSQKTNTAHCQMPTIRYAKAMFVAFL